MVTCRWLSGANKGNCAADLAIGAPHVSFLSPAEPPHYPSPHAGCRRVLSVKVSVKGGETKENNDCAPLLTVAERESTQE